MYIYIYIHTDVCMYVCVYICICKTIMLHMYICIYTYTYIIEAGGLHFLPRDRTPARFCSRVARPARLFISAYRVHISRITVYTLFINTNIYVYIYIYVYVYVYADPPYARADPSASALGLPQRAEVRAYGVVAEVPRFPLSNFRRKM